MSLRAVTLTMLGILLGACTSAATSAVVQTAQSAPTCPAGGTTMSKVELYFGLAIPGGGEVSKADWQAFVDTEVTPRFPDGLTIDEVSGQWRDSTTGKTVREPSRTIMILFTPSADAEAKIETIRMTYKTRFGQDSVMRVDEMTCVAFSQ